MKDIAIGNLYIHKLDVTDPESIDTSLALVKDILDIHGLDYLINNAAVVRQYLYLRLSISSTHIAYLLDIIQTEGNDLAFSMTMSGLMNSLQANVAGPALISQVYLPYLEKSKRKVIVNMTSGLSSIGLDCGKKNASYSIAKTALNMLVSVFVHRVV